MIPGTKLTVEIMSHFNTESNRSSGAVLGAADLQCYPELNPVQNNMVSTDTTVEIDTTATVCLNIHNLKQLKCHIQNNDCKNGLQ